MHRTTTTAALLVTVAVSALTGCVTVQRPPTAPSQPAAPRPDGRAESQIVQAPAREALEMIGPSRRPEPAAPPSHAAAPPVPARTPRQPPPPEHPVRPPRSEARDREDGRPRPPHARTPDVTRTVPSSRQDVCALGRKYGGWRADSPEAMICEQTYER